MGGDGFVGLDAGRDFTALPELVRDVVVEHLEAALGAGHAVDPAPEPRFVHAGPR